jgi:hypothetical protein
MIYYKYPTIASGATPIGSAGRAPDEELFWDGHQWRTRKEISSLLSVASTRNIDLKIYSPREREFRNSTILAIALSQRLKKSKDWRSRRLKKSKFEEVEVWRSRRIEEVKVLETQPESVTRVESRGLLTWVCPSGTHGLVHRVRPIMEVDKYKDSKIDLETKKEGSNPYSTRTLVKPSLVAYIKPGRGGPRGTSNTSCITS